MSAELEQWRNERKANELQLRRLTDASHDPVTTSLRSKAAELQAQIDDAQVGLIKERNVKKYILGNMRRSAHKTRNER